MNYYLAVDIGASSGRHILAHFEDGRIVLEEVYRFENFMTDSDGTLVWDIDHLVGEVVAGIAECGRTGKIPSTVAIDTWGVDYVLLDKDGREILPAVAYRDSRTVVSTPQVEAVVPFEELYSRTGIQRREFNSIYQIWSDKMSGKLAKASRLLFMPEYLSYKLTGEMKNEYTEATTSGLVDAAACDWDYELFDALGYPRSIVGELNAPGTPVGRFLPEIIEKVGFDALVTLAPAHDTASAVAACPIDDECVYISSGTWSLIGTENTRPQLTKEAMEADFTNEGGVERRYRFLKNIMGMWLFQNIRKDLGKKYSYDEMMEMARASDFDRTFDCNDSSLNTPSSMTDAVRALLGEPDLPVADVLKSVYLSLANSYDKAIREIEILSKKTISRILIVGGGSKDRYLNELTAKITGRTVVTGLSEATALGNILSQIMYDKKIDLASARELVKKSFDIKEYEK